MTDADRQAKGDPGRRGKRSRARAAAPPPAIGAIEAPDWLTDAERAIWSRMAAELRHMNFLKPVDAFALGRWCRHAVGWLNCCAVLVEHGSEHYETDSNHGKMLRVHPAATNRERHEKHLLDLEDRFGFNPRDRQKILMNMATRPIPDRLPLEGEPDARRASDAGAPAVGALAGGRVAGHA